MLRSKYDLWHIQMDDLMCKCEQRLEKLTNGLTAEEILNKVITNNFSYEDLLTKEEIKEIIQLSEELLCLDRSYINLYDDDGPYSDRYEPNQLTETLQELIFALLLPESAQKTAELFLYCIQLRFHEKELSQKEMLTGEGKSKLTYALYGLKHEYITDSASQVYAIELTKWFNQKILEMTQLFVKILKEDKLNISDILPTLNKKIEENNNV